MIAIILTSWLIALVEYIILIPANRIGSAAGLVRRYRVGTVYGPNYGEKSDEYDALFAACRDTGTAWTRPMGVLRLTTDHGVMELDPADENYGDDNNNSLITIIFKVAGYTYGPILGMFVFSIYTKREIVYSRWVPVIAIVSPVLCYFLDAYSKQLLGGYTFGFELLIVNGLITLGGLMIISRRTTKLEPDSADLTVGGMVKYHSATLKTKRKLPSL